MTELDLDRRAVRGTADGSPDYRRAVEQLRGETVAELGGQPMPPEALSAIALAVDVGAADGAAAAADSGRAAGVAGRARDGVVWLAAFRIQSVRYPRFHEHWRRKVVGLAAAAAVPGPEDLRFLRGR